MSWEICYILLPLVYIYANKCPVFTRLCRYLAHELFTCPFSAVDGIRSCKVAFAGHANPTSGLPSAIVKNSTSAMNVYAPIAVNRCQYPCPVQMSVESYTKHELNTYLQVVLPTANQSYVSASSIEDKEGCRHSISQKRTVMMSLRTSQASATSLSAQLP